MRLFRRIFWIAVLAVMTLFAVINMQLVTVIIDPIGLGLPVLAPLSMPLAYVVFFALTVGLLIGVVLENDRGRVLRRELREKKHEVSLLRQETDRMQQAMKAADHPDSAGLPATR